MADDATGTTTTTSTTDAGTGVGDPAGAAAAAANGGATAATAGTQDDLPPEVKRALTKANKEAETLRLQLKAFEDRDKTELQKAIERAEAAEKLANGNTLELARLRVAAATGLPPELAGRLQGKDEAELTADAEGLKKLLGVSPTATSFDGGARTTADRPQDMNDLIRRGRSR